MDLPQIIKDLNERVTELEHQNLAKTKDLLKLTKLVEQLQRSKQDKLLRTGRP